MFWIAPPEARVLQTDMFLWKHVEQVDRVEHIFSEGAQIGSRLDRGLGRPVDTDPHNKHLCGPFEGREMREN